MKTASQFKNAAEINLEKLETTSRKSDVIFFAIAYALLYIGTTLASHLGDITDQLKKLK